MDYECMKCGASGVKLWREYNTFINNQTLLCADCLCKAERVDPLHIRADGKTWDSYVQQWLDAVNSMVPAVPADDGTFWGCFAVPQDRVDWWRGLPLRKTRG
jgi:hypothetical protein